MYVKFLRMCHGPDSVRQNDQPEHYDPKRDAENYFAQLVHHTPFPADRSENRQPLTN